MSTGKRWTLAVAGGLIALALALLVISPVFAAETYQDDEIVIDEDVYDDVYAIGSDIIVDATVDGDVVAFGRTLTINGTVTGDVMFFGSALLINGTVEDDVRAAGALLHIAGDGVVEGDFMGASATLEMEPGSRIGGDVLYGGGQAVLYDVDGNVYVSTGGVRFNGVVGGDVNAEVEAPGQSAPFDWTALMRGMQPPGEQALPSVTQIPSGISFGEGARIEGDLSYASPEASEGVEQIVSGSVEFTQRLQEEGEQERRPISGWVRFIGRFVGIFVVALLLGVLLQQLAPEFLHGVYTTFKERPLASLGAGVLGYVVYFLLAGLMLVAAILVLFVLPATGTNAPLFRGITLAGMSLQVAFALFTRWLPVVLLGLLIGPPAYRLINKEEKIAPFWSLAVGLLIVSLVLAIPILGRFLLALLAGILGLGAVILYLWAKRQSGQSEAPPVEAPAPGR